MEEKKYPYLGVREYNGQEYVIMFTDKDYGVVVMSEIEGVDALRFGYIGEFDESLFKPLDKDRYVRLSN